MRVRLNQISSQTLPIDRLERSLGSFGDIEDQSTYGHVTKLALRLEDDAVIESLLIGTFSNWVYQARNVARAFDLDQRMERFFPVRRRTHYDVCISTQVGCAVDCSFCASSLLPFRRSLTEKEILAQLETLRRQLPQKKQLQRVYYSGIGEPLLNAEVVFEIARYLLARHYLPSTINTSGIIPAMEQLMSQRLPVNLIVSFHAPNDTLRKQLIPITKTYPLQDIVAVLKGAPEWMFIEAKYLMLRGINDSVEHAHQLADLLQSLNIHVTLQTYNKISEFEFEKSSSETTAAFARTLRQRGINVGFLNSNIGEAVEGGCGQMRMNADKAAKKRRMKKEVSDIPEVTQV